MTIAAKPTGRPAKQDSLASLARKLTKQLGFTVSVKSVRMWREKGYPLDDREKLLDALAGQQRVSGMEPPTDLQAAKLQKLCIDIESARFRLDVERGNYTHNDSIREQGRRIGSATRSELMRFKADCPTWEGMKAVEIERRVDALIDAICRNLNNAMGKCYQQ
ncbi:MAG: hypothetical protein IAE97_10540 [Chthoniobacterales bacterium]|nr:hypothetical protein [Chthoniobacterales bacterium]